MSPLPFLADLHPARAQAAAQATVLTYPIQGQGPDVAPSQRFNAAAKDLFLTDCVGERPRPSARVNYAFGDHTSPQHFVSHPTIEGLMGDPNQVNNPPGYGTWRPIAAPTTNDGQPGNPGAL